MKSGNPTESSRLLGKKPSVAASSQAQYGSSSSSPPEEHDVEDGNSVLSHVSLEATPTYGRLIGSHILSLLPAIALLLATFMLAFYAPCHVHYNPEDRRSDRKVCRHLLSDWMRVTAFSLGVLSWLAAYSFRPAVWKIVEWVTLLSQSCFDTSAGPRQFLIDTLSTLLFVFLRTSLLELIRMFNIIVINAVLFAGLAHLQRKGISEEVPLHWILYWYDPRFTVGLYTAIGWCSTEFLVSTSQMFDRLSLYRSSFGQIIPEEDANEAAANSTCTPPTSSFVDSLSAGEYTSDSAATVRARPDIHGKSHAAQNGHGHQKDRVVSLSSTLSQNLTAANEESGFSLADEAEEQEMKRLRETLEEEIVQARMRDDLQDTLGQPLTEVPILLCALWKIDSVIWNLGSTLLVSASVCLAQGPINEQIPRIFPPIHQIQTTLFFLIALHSIFTAAWTLLVGTLGFASITYASLLASLGLCIAGLFRWGLLM